MYILYQVSNNTCTRYVFSTVEKIARLPCCSNSTVLMRYVLSRADLMKERNCEFTIGVCLAVEMSFSGTTFSTKKSVRFIYQEI